MKYPAKVPVPYAARCLEQYLGRTVDNVELEGTVPETNALASVAKLRTRFFKKGDPASFEAFKAEYLADIDDMHWEQAIEEDPGLASYCRRWMKNKPYLPPSMKTKRARRSGSRSPSPTSGTSASKKKNIRIVNLFNPVGSNDEYPDQTVFTFKGNAGIDNDPNLPMPVCRGIRRVCRNYGSDNKYIAFAKDDSENNEYVVDVEYNRGSSSGGSSDGSSDEEGVSD